MSSRKVWCKIVAFLGARAFRQATAACENGGNKSLEVSKLRASQQAMAACEHGGKVCVAGRMRNGELKPHQIPALSYVEATLPTAVGHCTGAITVLLPRRP
eukprot:scaffold135049_cov13-Tisochrysis_lutea.AAC.1